MNDSDLIVSRHGRLGRIRLNRPKALNSLTLEMVRRFTAALREFGADPDIAAVLLTGEGERGLCAGGDIRMLFELRHGDKSHYRTFWREEYRLNAMIAAFPKPYVALMDGLVMGGGVGVSAHGNCRVVTERTRLAMPETGIGFVPDVGGSWLLSRAGAGGFYMALSGATVSGADALFVGLADVAIHSRSIPELIERLQQVDRAESVDLIAADLSCQLEKSELELNKKILDDAMAGATVENVLDLLANSVSTFSQRAAAQIRGNSPTSLKVTHALLGLAASAGRLEPCLVNEYRAACSLLDSHDLYEGIRAAIVDKDKAPKWSPATLEQVDEAMVEKILAGDGSLEPTFFQW